MNACCPGDIPELFYHLDGARYLRLDEERALLYVWHGGHTVNIFATDGDEVDCFTFGHELPHDHPALALFAREKIDERVDGPFEEDY
jgi:hypothetical protein